MCIRFVSNVVVETLHIVKFIELYTDITAQQMG